MVAFVFGSSVLIAELVDGSSPGGGHGAMSAATPQDGHAAEAAPVRGLSATSDSGLTLDLDRPALPRSVATTLSFRVLDRSGAPVRDFAVEHEKRMHLIVVRRDLTGFQHLHPTMSADGTWSTDLKLAAAGTYRVYADFKRDGRNETLAHDVNVGGPFAPVAVPAATETARTTGGYEVALEDRAPHAGAQAPLTFEVGRGGRAVTPQPYLGARGHLVVLRASDLAYLHVHPSEEAPGRAGSVSFATEFATPGRYRLFLQFKHQDRVRTAAFTKEVAR